MIGVIVVTLSSGTGKNLKEIVPQSIVNRIVMNIVNICNLVVYKFLNRLLFEQMTRDDLLTEAQIADLHCDKVCSKLTI